jgi:hypothetical protein
MNFDTLMKTDDNNQFALAVADINKRGVALQLDIQKYLVAVAARWTETGDVRPAVDRINMLIDKKALFKGVRRNAILTWVEAMLGFEYITDGDHKDKFHANKAKASGFELADLTKQENHWYQFAPEPEYKPLDLNILLKALVEKAEKRAKTAKASDNIPADQLAALKALVRSDEQQEQAADDATLEAGLTDA